MMAFEKNKYKDLFCTEAEEQVEILSRTLLSYEKDPSHTELHKDLMRSAHTIKGASATMEYLGMAELAHVIEDVFHSAEQGTFVVDSHAVSVLLSATDSLSASLSSIKEHDVEIDVKDIVAKLKNLLVTNEVTSAVSPIKNPKENIPLMRVATSDTVKVNVDKLDTLMGIFEETLILRLRLDALLGFAVEAMQTITDPALKKKLFFIDEFKTTFTELARVLSLNQDALLAIRLVPLDQIFGQYPRMVRDLAIREGKKIEFVVRGGDIMLDRTVIDGLGGALAHLLRNAVDHGIGTEGTIQLFATREKGRARVVVEDNGGGINYARVKEVAILHGVETPEKVALMSNDAVAELLFHPNMSTNNTVTDISGRGVGLFAVRGFAQDVGGRVEVVSPIPETGIGTRFVLDLPISLATVRVLLVDTHGYTFAIPFESIVRTIKFTTDEVTGTVHQETLFLDGILYPLIQLEKLLQLNFGGHKVKRLSSDMRTGVIVQTGKTTYILEVDVCVGERDLLVKSLPQILRDNKGFSGSALLSDGRTILLLDAHGLLSHVVSDILRQTTSET